DTTLAEDYPVVKETIKSIEKKVIEFRIPYCIKPVSEIGPDDLVITPFSHANMHSHGAYSMALKLVDSCLRKGKGIQIGVREKENVSKWHDYKACLDDLETTGIVGIGRYENAAIVAAQLMRLESGLRIVNDMKYSTDPKNPGKKMKLESHPGLTVKEGLYQGGK
ncbi:MAG: hypothetical protein KKE20_02365, partial [Nanoarchaeota archaeon]|nr:hypothetical protein [Nanoarchaeota archaeon]